jgi:hypothetical protein
MHIGIIGAMDSEVAYLKEVLQDKREEERYGYVFHTGMIGESTVSASSDSTKSMPLLKKDAYIKKPLIFCFI